MLTPVWYLTDGDFFADFTTVMQPDRIAAAIGLVEELFGDEGGFSPQQTLAATYLALLAAEHLDLEITYNARRHTLTDLIRLAHGLNFVHTHLTQIIQKLAAYADKRTLPGLADLPAAAVKTFIESLCAAGASGEVCAGHLKEAHLTLRCAAN